MMGFVDPAVHPDHDAAPPVVSVSDRITASVRVSPCHVTPTTTTTQQWWCSSKRIGTRRSEYVIVKVLPLEQVCRRQGKGPNLPSSMALPLPVRTAILPYLTVVH